MSCGFFRWRHLGLLRSPSKSYKESLWHLDKANQVLVRICTEKKPGNLGTRSSCPLFHVCFLPPTPTPGSGTENRKMISILQESSLSEEMCTVVQREGPRGRFAQIAIKTQKTSSWLYAQFWESLQRVTDP